MEVFYGCHLNVGFKKTPLCSQVSSCVEKDCRGAISHLTHFISRMQTTSAPPPPSIQGAGSSVTCCRPVSHLTAQGLSAVFVRLQLMQLCVARTFNCNCTSQRERGREFCRRRDWNKNQEYERKQSRGPLSDERQ